MLIKDAIKNVAIKYGDKAYKKSIDGAVPSYDKWIRDKESDLERFDMSVRGQSNEAEEDAKAMSRLSYVTTYEGSSFRIIPYSAIDSSFDIKNYIEDFIIFANGELTDRAIPLLFKAFADNPDVDICYGDEDIATLDAGDLLKYGRSVVGTRKDPYFKPDWSPNAFLHRFYFCNVAAIRRSSFREKATPGNAYGARLIYEMLLEYIFKDEKTLRRSVVNISEILIHAANYNCADIKLEKARDYAKNLRCLQDDDIRISVVIPSRNNPDLLDKCLTSLKNALHTGTETEIIVVDNGSDPDKKEQIEEVLSRYNATYIYNPMEFNFSAQCNA